MLRWLKTVVVSDEEKARMIASGGDREGERKRTAADVSRSVNAEPILTLFCWLKIDPLRGRWWFWLPGCGAGGGWRAGAVGAGSAGVSVQGDDVGVVDEAGDGRGVERQVADFVDDQDPVAVQALELAGEPAVVAGAGEAGDPAGRRVERDRAGRFGGLDGQRDRDMRFACPGRAEKDDVLLPGDERGGGQVRNNVTRHGGHVGEGEVLQRLDPGQPRGADPHPGAVHRAGRDLAARDSREVFLV